MTSSLDRLILMANQISRNFQALGHESAVKATADHVASFWDPRMRRMIFEALETAPALSESARAALILLRDRGAPAHQTRATEFNVAGESGHSDAG